MKDEVFYLQENKKKRSAYIAKKVCIFLFIIMQLPVFIQFAIGDYLYILFALVSEVILIIGLFLNYLKKTCLAAAIVSAYFYVFFSSGPFLFDNLNVTVPAIIAIFVTNTYIIDNRLFQRYNVSAAILSLIFFYKTSLAFYKDMEYITDMSFWTICCIIIGSIIYYFRRDINQYQKILEEKLNFLKQITDTNPHFIYTTDTQNNFTFVNESMGNYDGENSSKLIGESINNFWDTSFRKDQLSTKSKKNYTLNSFKSKANETYYHEVFETPMLDTNGYKIGYLGVSIDVTEKRVAQMNLKKSEIKYRELFENNQLGIVTGKNGKFHKVNNTFCDMTGYARTEIIGLEISKIMHLEDYLATKYLAVQLEKGEAKGHSFEHRFIRKDKSIGFAIVHMHKSSFRYPDNSYHVVATLTDISKLKATEAALKESEAIYRTLVNHAFDGIEIHESIPPLEINGKWTHRMVLRNNKIYDILNAASSNIKKNSFSFKDILAMSPTHQRNGVQSTEYIKSLSPKFQENKVLTFEWQYGNKQSFIDTEMTIIRFKIEDKHYVTSIYKDISERKKAELKLKKSLRKIERKNKKIKKALDSNDALEKFAFSVSHELKDPLISIQGFAELLEKSIKIKRTENNLRDINAIIHSTQNMRNVINKFLLFARLDTQKIMIKKIDLSKLLEHLLEELHVLIAVNKVSLQFKNIPENIYVDETLIHQLFQNLISNAIKYSSPLRLPKIIIEAKESEQFWNFTVEDNGIGIAPDFHKSIFNFFERVDASSNKGTGIGLALCKKIVKNHGGKINLTSEVDKGSIFKFSISKNLKYTS